MQVAFEGYSILEHVQKMFLARTSMGGEWGHHEEAAQHGAFEAPAPWPHGWAHTESGRVGAAQLSTATSRRGKRIVS